MNFKTFYRTNRLRMWVIAFSSLMQPFVLIAAAYLNMLEINTLRDHNKKAWLIIVLPHYWATCSPTFLIWCPTIY